MPVLIVPQKFYYPENIILAYDGSESSLYAIKQFAYIFPEFCNTNITVVFAAKENDRAMPDELLIHEFAARHFNDLNFLNLIRVIFIFPTG